MTENAQGRGPIRHNVDRHIVADHLHFEPVGKHHEAMRDWYDTKRADGQMHEIMPDFHRLQLEKWIHDRCQVLMGTGPLAGTSLQSGGEADAADLRKAIDFGVITRRGWQDNRYVTAGVNGPDEQIKIDLTQSIPADSEHFQAYDVVICSEVLEHVQRPFDAVDTLWYLCKPGGTLLVTSPFMWPDHATPEYPDYWRFTEGAWRLLMKHADFEIGAITPAAWTHDGNALYQLLRKVECWGFFPQVEACTGFMVEAVKKTDANRRPGGMVVARPEPAS